MSQYEYQATVHHVVDGDTVYFNLTKMFNLTVDFGFNILDTVTLTKTAVMDFRLYGINTPEVVGITKTAGLAASAELARLLGLGSIRVVSYKADKYGRWLADIYVQPATGVEIWVNQTLINGGFAKPYFGEGPKT
jgi:endonuclease YncB( thermonuclease family)